METLKFMFLNQFKQFVNKESFLHKLFSHLCLTNLCCLNTFLDLEEISLDRLKLLGVIHYVTNCSFIIINHLWNLAVQRVSLFWYRGSQVSSASQNVIWVLSVFFSRFTNVALFTMNVKFLGFSIAAMEDY